jgi:hypothetical protein
MYSANDAPAHYCLMSLDISDDDSIRVNKKSFAEGDIAVDPTLNR